VKTNIVHTLFRVQKYGLMSLDQFKDLLSPAEFKRCKKSQKKTWYSLPLNVFTNFTFQVISLFDFIISCQSCNHQTFVNLLPFLVKLNFIFFFYFIFL
jgi:hypothetical protein